MNELDQIVIGILLANPSRIPLVRLSAGDFTDPDMRVIFSSMLAMVTEGLEPEPFSLHDRYPSLSLATLVDLLRSSRSITNLDYYVAELRKRARAERCMELIAQAHENLQARRDADKVRVRLATRLVELDQEQTADQFDQSQAMDSALDYLEMAQTARREKRLIGLPTGITYLDNDTGGLHAPNLVVVGARPAQGKTAFGLTVAINAALRGFRVGIVSTEMSLQELALREVAMLSGVDHTKLRDGRVTESDYRAVDKAMVTLRGLPIRILDKSTCPVSRVFVQAKGWQLQGGLDLLIVDYLGRLAPDHPVESRAREVGIAAAAMKNVARQLRIPVVVLAQLNRGSVTAGVKRPTMADLRDSGEIEQEADLVLLLHRPHAYDANAQPTEGEIIVDKNRHGPCGLIRCTFVPETMRWLNGAPYALPIEG